MGEVVKIDNPHRGEATIRHTVECTDGFNKELSPMFYVRNFLWSIKISRNTHLMTRPALGVFIQCFGHPGSDAWCCHAKATIKLLGATSNKPPIIAEFSRLFLQEKKRWGIQSLLPWHEVINPATGYISNNSITIEVHLTADVPTGVPWDTKMIGQLQRVKIGETVDMQNNHNKTVDIENNKQDMANYQESEMEAAIRESLRCPVCHLTMQAPIHQCVKGHSHCHSCRRKIKHCSLCRDQFSKARNIKLEQLSEAVLLSCEDCYSRIPAHLMTIHSKQCPARLSPCILNHPSCNWHGLQSMLLAHFIQCHPDLVWDNTPRVFVHTDFDGALLTNLIVMDTKVFVMTRKYNTVLRQLTVAVQHLQEEEGEEVRFDYKFQVINANDRDRFVCRRETCIGDLPSDAVLKAPYVVCLKNDILVQFKRDVELICKVDVYVSS